ncbi:hypothetical protein IC582_019560 [Cucumis melo]
MPLFVNKVFLTDLRTPVLEDHLMQMNYMKNYLASLPWVTKLLPLAKHKLHLLLLCLNLLS